MSALTVVHIGFGSLGLISGYLALYSGKGTRLHRKSGMVFVAVMLAMCITGFTMAVTRNVAVSINVSAAVLTAYLIISSLATVRPPASGSRLLLIIGLVAAAGVVAANTRFTSLALTGRSPNGLPMFPFLMFGSVALFGVVGDVRVMLRGPLRGASRMARHLWRMSFALFIAALSFFIGQSDELPAQFRIMPLLGLPVLAVAVTMFYWLWRVRVRQSLRGLIVDAQSPTTRPLPNV